MSGMSRVSDAKVRGKGPRRSGVGSRARPLTCPSALHFTRPPDALGGAALAASAVSPLCEQAVLVQGERASAIL